jgi:hypothetical protein
VSQLYAEAKGNGLIIKENKTKYMIISRSKARWKIKQNIIIKDFSYERVDKLIYLGSWITEDNEIAEEIEEILTKGNG